MGFDLLSLGELLVDMVAVSRGGGQGTGTGSLFSRAAGGAPANVAAGAARLMGRKARVGFVGRVGADPFGRFLAATLGGFGVDTTHLTLSADAHTPIAVVSKPEGSEELEFSFYGHDGGKRLALISAEDLPQRELMESRFVTLGGVSLSHPVSAEAAMQAAQYAASGGALLAFDPNWRPALWRDPQEWAGAAYRLLPFVDVLKVSRAELMLLGSAAAQPEPAPHAELVSATDALARMSARGRPAGKPLLVAITLGPQGAAYALYSDPTRSGKADELATVETFPVNVVDPTGAGDAFLAGLLTGLSSALPASSEGERMCLDRLPRGALYGILRFANAAGALTTTRRGAMSGLPTLRAVEDLIKKYGV